MSEPLSARIRIAARDAVSAYNRLVLVVGPARSGKTAALQHLAKQEGWALVNVNLRLSEGLLELTQRQRALRTSRIVGEIVEATRGETAMLDNLEILFSSELKLDPLRLLQGLSRNRTIVAAWPGTMDGDTLLYGEPDHPEYRRETKPGAIIVSCGNADQLTKSKTALGERQA